MKKINTTVVRDDSLINAVNKFPELILNVKKIVISSDDLSIDMVIEQPKDIKFRSITINGINYFRNEPTEEVGENTNKVKLATEKTNKFTARGWPYECQNPEYPLQTSEEAAQLLGSIGVSATTLSKLDKERKNKSDMQSKDVTLTRIIEENTTSGITEWTLCDIVSGRTQCFTAYAFAKDAAEFHDERKDSVWDWFIYGVGGYGLEIIYRGNH